MPRPRHRSRGPKASVSRLPATTWVLPCGPNAALHTRPRSLGRTRQSILQKKVRVWLESTFEGHPSPQDRWRTPHRTQKKEFDGHARLSAEQMLHWFGNKAPTVNG